MTRCEINAVPNPQSASLCERVLEAAEYILVARMPEQDGYELIKKVRETESADNTASIPALALTEYAKAEDRVRALAGGYQVHLSKPVEPAEFVLVVANLAGRGQSS